MEFYRYRSYFVNARAGNRRSLADAWKLRIKCQHEILREVPPGNVLIGYMCCIHTICGTVAWKWRLSHPNESIVNLIYFYGRRRNRCAVSTPHNHRGFIWRKINAGPYIIIELYVNHGKRIDRFLGRRVQSNFWKLRHVEKPTFD